MNSLWRKSSVWIFLLVTLRLFALERELVPLYIRVFPESAQIVDCDGRVMNFRKEKNSWQFALLEKGKHSIRIKAEGYFTKRLCIDLNGEKYFEIKLERKDSRFTFKAKRRTGIQPKSVEFTPDGDHLIVTQLGWYGIDIFSLHPFNHIKELSLPPDNPTNSKKTGFVESAFLEKKNEIWISQMTTSKVHIVSLDTFSYMESIDSGGKWSKVIAFTPDEKIAFISNWVSEDISLIDVEKRECIDVIPVSGTPRGLAVTPDGKYLYVCIFDTGNIEKIHIKKRKSEKLLELGPGAKRHIVIDREGDYGYFSDMYTGKVGILDISHDKLVRERRIGSNVNTIKLSHDARYLFVSVRGKNHSEGYLKKGPEFGMIKVVDTKTLRVVDWMWGKNQPTGLALSPDNTYLAYTNFLDHDLELYNISAFGKE